jgi:membrane protease YdiL (CAAX protease family)
MLLCLPVTATTTWYFVRWWLSSDAIPLPAGNALPAIRWPTWFGLLLFLGMQVAMGLVVQGYAAAGDAGLVPWTPGPAYRMFSPGIFLGQIVPPLVGLAVIRLFGRGAAATVGVRVGRVGPTLLYGVVAFAAILPVCLAALWINTLVAGMVGVEPKVHLLLETVREAPQTWVLVVSLAQAAVLASLSEEFMYRGVLMMSLLRQTGAAPAIALSSAVFAIMHLPGEPQAVLPLFLLGATMAYVAYRTRSLLAPVVTHTLFNTLMVLGTFSGAE